MLNSEFVVSAAGAVIALLFAYFPALNTWYAGQKTEIKSLIMIGLMFAVAFGVWGAGCAGWLDSGIACTAASIPDLIKLVILAVVANQGVYQIAPQVKAVQHEKAMRNANQILHDYEHGEG